MFALRRYHSKGQNSVTRLLHYWADVSRAWGFRVRTALLAASTADVGQHLQPQKPAWLLSCERMSLTHRF